MGSNVDCVFATSAQIAEILPILMDSILGHYFDERTALQILKGAQKRRELVVAFREDWPVGFYVNASRGAFLVFPYLHLLAVKTSERGRGVGTALLANLEQSLLAAPGYPARPKVFLLVAQDNPDAVRFYERHGYERKAVIDDMFGPGDTEFLMMKDLGSKRR